MDPRIRQAADLMLLHAERTGVIGGRRARRYLWTDAFAVCNFLGLARATGEGRYLELALRLVERVHSTLGRHRPDDVRKGWLSGLDEAEAERHPTRGGLRIGKPLPERAPGEAPDEVMEWNRDGQYFHYLTRWMHALDQTARATRQPLFNLWARELAEVAHRAFTMGGKRMVWKMSIDLSRPVVASMGQHDPLDGFLTCAQLVATAKALGSPTGPMLAGPIASFAAMIDRDALTTADALGIGGLLVDAHRAAELRRAGALPDAAWLLDTLLEAALAGLRVFEQGRELRSPASRRLAFRELGLAIGIAAAGLVRDEAPGLLGRLDGLAPLRAEIERFWLSPEHQRTAPWLEHQDINQVMLATSLAPDGYLSMS